jgi:very-short-patch-repair endonuclease
MRSESLDSAQRARILFTIRWRIHVLDPIETKYASNAVACKLWGLVESPPELILGMALFERLSTYYEKWQCWIYSQEEYGELLWAPDLKNRRGSFAIVPQLAYEVVGRVDFAIFIPGLTHNVPIVVLECDGHQFHERTVQQASKDRKRDRDFLKYGIPILRFTGTDIVRQSAELAEEIAEFIDIHAAEKELRAFQDRGIDLNKIFENGEPLPAPYPWPRIRAGSDMAARVYGD